MYGKQDKGRALGKYIGTWKDEYVSERNERKRHSGGLSIHEVVNEKQNRLVDVQGHQ